MVGELAAIGRALRRLVAAPIAAAAKVPGADRYRKRFRTGAHLWVLLLHGLLDAPSFRTGYAAIVANHDVCRAIGLPHDLSFSHLARSSSSRPVSWVETLFTHLQQRAQRRPSRRGSSGNRLGKCLVLDSSFLPLRMRSSLPGARQRRIPQVFAFRPPMPSASSYRSRW